MSVAAGLSARFPPHARVGFLNLHRSCEGSSYLLSRVRRFVELAGYPLREDPAEADVVVVNTCVVTDEMQHHNEQTISELLARRPDVEIVVLGCLAGLPEQARTDRPARVKWVSTRELGQLDELFFAEVSIASVRTSRLCDFEPYQSGMTSTGRYLQISEGCVHACSYCNIKRAKGAVRSRTIDELLAETSSMLAGGAEELTLLSDDCGSYGRDLETSLADLLDAFAARLPRARLKIYSMHPGPFMEQYVRLRPHLLDGRVSYVCVPVQSGSPRVLSKMRRPVELSALAAILDEVRRGAPRVRLFSHFILGFPGETDEDFEQSLRFATHFDEALFIGYGDNEHTPAALLGPKCTLETIDARRDRVRGCIARGELKGIVV
jgi:MiaB/RimO family radical SAM methylthiotransferase